MLRLAPTQIVLTQAEVTDVANTLASRRKGKEKRLQKEISQQRPGVTGHRIIGLSSNSHPSSSSPNQGWLPDFYEPASTVASPSIPNIPSSPPSRSSSLPNSPDLRRRAAAQDLRPHPVPVRTASAFAVPSSSRSQPPSSTIATDGSTRSNLAVVGRTPSDDLRASARFPVSRSLSYRGNGINIFDADAASERIMHGIFSSLRMNSADTIGHAIQHDTLTNIAVSEDERDEPPLPGAISPATARMYMDAIEATTRNITRSMAEAAERDRTASRIETREIPRRSQTSDGDDGAFHRNRMAAALLQLRYSTDSDAEHSSANITATTIGNTPTYTESDIQARGGFADSPFHLSRPELTSTQSRPSSAVNQGAGHTLPQHASYASPINWPAQPQAPITADSDTFLDVTSTTAYPRIAPDQVRAIESIYCRASMCIRPLDREAHEGLLDLRAELYQYLPVPEWRWGQFQQFAEQSFASRLPSTLPSTARPPLIGEASFAREDGTVEDILPTTESSEERQHGPRPPIRDTAAFLESIAPPPRHYSSGFALNPDNTTRDTSLEQTISSVPFLSASSDSRALASTLHRPEAQPSDGDHDQDDPHPSSPHLHATLAGEGRLAVMDPSLLAELEHPLHPPRLVWPRPSVLGEHTQHNDRGRPMYIWPDTDITALGPDFAYLLEETDEERQQRQQVDHRSRTPSNERITPTPESSVASKNRRPMYEDGEEGSYYSGSEDYDYGDEEEGEQMQDGGALAVAEASLPLEALEENSASSHHQAGEAGQEIDEYWHRNSPDLDQENL